MILYVAALMTHSVGTNVGKMRTMMYVYLQYHYMVGEEAHRAKGNIIETITIFTSNRQRCFQFDSDQKEYFEQHLH